MKIRWGKKCKNKTENREEKKERCEGWRNKVVFSTLVQWKCGMYKLDYPINYILYFRLDPEWYFLFKEFRAKRKKKRLDPKWYESRREPGPRTNLNKWVLWVDTRGGNGSDQGRIGLPQIRNPFFVSCPQTRPVIRTCFRFPPQTRSDWGQGCPKPDPNDPIHYILIFFSQTTKYINSFTIWLNFRTLT